jgi:hypothetical protein
MLYSINKTGYIRSNTGLGGFMEDLRGFHWDCIYIYIYISWYGCKKQEFCTDTVEISWKIQLYNPQNTWECPQMCDASHLTNILVRTRFQNLGFCGSKYWDNLITTWQRFQPNVMGIPALAAHRHKFASKALDKNIIQWRYSALL